MGDREMCIERELETESREVGGRVRGEPER